MSLSKQKRDKGRTGTGKEEDGVEEKIGIRGTRRRRQRRRMRRSTWGSLIRIRTMRMDAGVRVEGKSHLVSFAPA